MVKTFYITFAVLVLSIGLTYGQGQFSGNLELNANFFIRDSLIGAANTPQYDRQKSGGESWMTLNYSNWGFDVGLRFDLYANSNNIIPTQSYSAQGIGRFHITKKINNLSVTGGYIYDQIGAGILFRSFEARPLAIDNSLVGARASYEFSKNWKVKAFMGKQKKVELQKNLFEVYDPLIMGAAVNGYFKKSDSSKVEFAPGAGILKRTLDDATMNSIVAQINNDSAQYRFVPKYNTYGFSLYNTLTAGKFSWYTEFAYKTQEAIKENNIRRTGFFLNRAGTVFYNTLSYATKGLGVTFQTKYVDGFYMRVSPLMDLNRGGIAYLPPMQRINTYRLTGRYNAASQEVGEWSYMLDVMWKAAKHLDIAFSYTHIGYNSAWGRDKQVSEGGALVNRNVKLNVGDIFTKADLFREVYVDATYKFRENKSKVILGVQYIEYNQKIFEQKGDDLPYDMVKAFTPFVEYVHKIDRKKSIRAEVQYMATKQDLGNFVFGLVEFNIAPHWSFTVADLLNINPKEKGKRRHDSNGKEIAPINYPTLAIFYTQGASRFSLAFVKQPQGVVCTGGICRVEPAFSGFRFTLNSRF